jgi:hypothetical protein
MSQRFFVVYENRADFTLATDLADRVMAAKIDWLDAIRDDGSLDKTVLDSQRQWVGEDQPGQPLTWASIPGRAEELGIKVHGHFNGEPGVADARAARRALAYVLRRHENEAVAAILLIRDMDDQDERRQGLNQARDSYTTSARIVIGVAASERECWVISGFEPKNDAETAKLAAETKKLGFDPRRESHQLTACKDDQANRSPKRVLRELIGQNWDRERECWEVTDLSVLDERGEGNGLRDYLSEVRSFIVPLITGYQRDPAAQ